MRLDVVAIVLSLGLLMAIAYRGLPVILFAPVCALLAAGLSGRPLLPSYTETFTMSAAPHVNAAGRPDGTEPVSAIQSLSRTFTSPGGHDWRTWRRLWEMFIIRR